MSDALGCLECRICGRSVYFIREEEAIQDGQRLIELTCSRGHTDRYFDVDVRSREQGEPRVEMSRAAAVGF